MMKPKIAALVALGLAASMTLAGCAGGSPNTTNSSTTVAKQDITLWLIGGDTPDTLRTYLKDQYTKVNGGTLTIEQQDWGTILQKLTTNLPDAANTPDVTEIGNTQSPTYTNVGAFADITDMYQNLGGSKLLQSFVDAGTVSGKIYTLPYYFGSRYVFYRKDVWTAAGITSIPTTLDQFNQDVITIAQKNPDNITGFSGMYIGGQDWRNGISWIFANGGNLAKQGSDGKWTMTLDDPNTIKGLQQLQQIQQQASKAPKTATDANVYQYLNDTDTVANADKTTTPITLAAATTMAPGWAHWSIGTLGTDGKTRTWDDKVWGVFPLPGNDGKPAPVFAGGSNIGISAKSTHKDAARQLMTIIFSADFQKMLGGAGLGPGNSDYTSSLGTDEFAKALIDSASNSKLTPAAVGWATVENSTNLEKFFQAVAEGGDIATLAKQYDDLLTPMLNGS